MKNTFILAAALYYFAGLPASVVAQSACIGPSDGETLWRNMIVGVATRTGPAADQERQTWNIPQALPSEVLLVTDSATCAQALNTMVSRGSTASGPVLLYRVGATRYVLRLADDPAGHLTLLHVLDSALCYLASVAM